MEPSSRRFTGVLAALCPISFLLHSHPAGSFPPLRLARSWVRAAAFLVVPVATSLSMASQVVAAVVYSPLSAAVSDSLRSAAQHPFTDSGAAFFAAVDPAGAGAGVGRLGCTGGGILSTGGGVGAATVGGGATVALGVAAGAGSDSSRLCYLHPASSRWTDASIDKTTRIS